MIVTGNNYHIDIICVKLNDLKLLYLSETLLWPLQTFLMPIASVRKIPLTSECFFNFCFKRVSNNRTNPQGDSYFKACHRPLWEMMMKKSAQKECLCLQLNERSITSCWVCKFARVVVLGKYKIKTVSKTNWNLYWGT